MYTSEVKIVEENGVKYEVETVYVILENGDKKFHHESKIMIAEPSEPEPSQLDRIESAVSNTLEEIRAEAVDEYTLSLMENNII